MKPASKLSLNHVCYHVANFMISTDRDESALAQTIGSQQGILVCNGILCAGPGDQSLNLAAPGVAQYQTYIKTFTVPSQMP